MGLLLFSRRAEAHLARKLARKAGFPVPSAAPSPEPAAAAPVEPQFPEPGFPFPPLSAISPAAAGPEPSDTQNHPAPATTAPSSSSAMKTPMASKR